MALAIVSFNLYTDTLLTNLSSSIAYEAESDLSDGPHDYTRYFGSPDASTKLQTAVNPGVNDIILSPLYILPTWAATHLYSLGESVIPATPNGYRYEVTTAGTSAGTEPAWGVVVNGNTTDGTVVWRLVAEDSPTSEIKMSLTLAGLNTAIGGASLNIGNTILGGPANNKPIYIRLTNTITQVSDSIGTPELAISINAVRQTPV